MHLGGRFQTQIKLGMYSAFWASLGYIGRPYYLTDKKQKEVYLFIYFLKSINT